MKLFEAEDFPVLFINYYLGKLFVSRAINLINVGKSEAKVFKISKIFF